MSSPFLHPHNQDSECVRVQSSYALEREKAWSCSRTIPLASAQTGSAGSPVLLRQTVGGFCMWPKGRQKIKTVCVGRFPKALLEVAWSRKKGYSSKVVFQRDGGTSFSTVLTPPLHGFLSPHSVLKHGVDCTCTWKQVLMLEDSWSRIISANSVLKVSFHFSSYPNHTAYINRTDKDCPSLLLQLRQSSQLTSTLFLPNCQDVLKEHENYISGTFKGGRKTTKANYAYTTNDNPRN